MDEPQSGEYIKLEEHRAPLQEVSEVEMELDESRELWKNKIEAALQSLRADEQRARENIDRHWKPNRLSN